MKIISSIGNSKTHWDGSKLERRVEVTRPTVSEQNRDADLHTLISKEAKILMRQYIGILDKVLTKEKNLRLMSVERYERREQLGQAVWELISRKNVGAKFEFWRAKLHPYADFPTAEEDLRALRDRAPAGAQPDRIYGRLKTALWAQDAQGNPNYKQIAQNIDAHLFTAKVSASGQKKSGHGLIWHRANSIRTSNLWTAAQNTERPSLELSEPRLKAYQQGTYANVAAHIFSEVRRRESQNEPVGTTLFGKILSDHFAPLKKPGQKFTSSDRDLLDLHNQVKKFYANKVRKSTRHLQNTRTPLSYRLPADMASLVRALNRKQGNATMTALIREGRNIYHAARRAHSAEQMPACMQALKTSSALTALKHSEAFERFWRTAISQASRTLKYWADPKGEIFGPETAYVDDDILSNEVGIKATTKCFVGLPHYNRMAKLVFGDPLNEAGGDSHGDDSVFATEDEQLAKQRLFALLRVAARLRTQVFHFGDAAKLKASLHKLEVAGNWNDVEGFSDLLAFARARLETDMRGLKQRSKDVIMALKVPWFVPGHREVEDLFKASLLEPDRDLLIPRFGRILHRNHNLKGHFPKDDTRSQFPDKISTVTKNDEAATCHFGALQLIYNSAFRVWLIENNGTSKFADAADQVIREATARAKAMNNTGPFADLVESRLTQVPQLHPGKNLQEWFDQLTQVVAAETRQNRTYVADRKKARKNSHAIEDLKCDFFALLFAQFLESPQGKPFQWLARGRLEKRTYVAHPPAFEDAGLDRDLEDWEALFYVFLYLVPVQDTSRLMTQFVKARVLETKETRPDEHSDYARKLRDLCLLYGKMAGAHMVNILETSGGLADVADLFEDRGHFQRVFAPQQDLSVGAKAAEERRVEGLKTGLRQILRFGTLPLLQNLHATSKISEAEVSSYLRDLPRVAGFEKKKHDLHNKIVKSKKNHLDAEETAEYQKITEALNKFKFLAERVRLSDMTRLHILLMRLVSRLIDFSATWERDALFVALALYQRQQGHGNQDLYEFAKKLSDRPSFKRGPLVLENLTQDNQSLYNKYFGEEQAKIRNAFAHFTILKPGLNLTSLINDVRRLMTYDRKLRNAVSKAIKDLMLDEGIEVRWETCDEHRLHKPQEGGLSAVPVWHLASFTEAKFEVDRVSTTFLKTLEKLAYGQGKND